jgi:hypothetical protein
MSMIGGPCRSSPRRSMARSLGTGALSPKRCTTCSGRKGLELLTNVRKPRQNRLMRLWEKLLRRNRALIETINDQLKNISQIEHTRHRSVTGCMVNLMAGLVAYSYRPKKPSLSIRRTPVLPVLIV